MECILFHNSSVRNMINKTLEQLDTTEMSFLSQEDILSPIITVKNLNPKANYVYLDILGRYYFINKWSVKNNGLFILELQVDVLYTYREEIMNNPCNVIASDNVLNDNSVDYTSEEKAVTITYPMQTPFTDNKEIILIGV